ncbi:hypothetical protein [Ensifer adhaerens]
MATKATIADLFPDHEGMILVAKDVSDGLPRRITEVANGGDCGCVCFGCGRRMIARNGGDPELRAYSFAHRPEDNVVDCVSSGETALHIRAKEIIAKHCRVTLPATSTPGIDGRPVDVSPERSVDLTDIHPELVVGEVIPDIVATMPDGRRIFIEIANTHLCSPEKIEKLDAMGVEVLEIVVTQYRSHPLDELDDIILDVAPPQADPQLRGEGDGRENCRREAAAGGCEDCGGETVGRHLPRSRYLEPQEGAEARG